MNTVEIGLAFIEGLALIASPCILPVLPLVLAASVEGGRKRPFGIILGFVLSFTLFAFFSRKLVQAFDIDTRYLTYGSLILLALFAVILLSETLSGKFSALTQRFANFGNTLTARAGGGFGSGLFIGMLIGLVWTPCAGPVLAAVLVQIIRQESDTGALILLSTFSLGAGVPMLIIALTGRAIMNKLSFFTRHAVAMRKAFGVIILLAVAFIASGGDAVALFSRDEKPLQTTESTGLQDALAKPYPAPEIKGVSAWLNSDPLTLESLKGKVVLIDFWTYSCINCVRTLPYLTQWDEAYRDDGLVIIGIHAPEFVFEKRKENVEDAVKAHNIRYPVALDNDFDTWRNFQNRYWPAHYLINKEGQVVYTHFGEGKYAQTENNIRYLLGLQGMADKKTEERMVSRDQTHETYLGYARSTSFASPGGITRDAPANYSLPGFIPSGHWALSGKWTIAGERITAEENGASLQLNFTAGRVFLVLGTRSGEPVEVTLKLNGNPPGNAAGKDVRNGTLTVGRHTLYELVNQGEVKNGLLEIMASAPGLEAYAFTFGK